MAIPVYNPTNTVAQNLISRLPATQQAAPSNVPVTPQINTPGVNRVAATTKPNPAVAPTPKPATFDTSKTAGLMAALSRQTAGTATDVDLKNLAYAKSQGFVAPTAPATHVPPSVPNSTTTAATPVATPVPSTATAAAPSQADQLSTLRQSYLDSLVKTPEETALEKQLADLSASYRTGNQNTQDQVIPMEFITGEQQSLQNQYNDSSKTLTDRLALLQADRNAKANQSKAAYDTENSNTQNEAGFKNSLVQSGYTPYNDKVDTTGVMYKAGLNPDQIAGLNKLISKPLSQWTDIDIKNYQSATGKTVTKPNNVVTLTDPITGKQTMYLKPQTSGLKEIGAGASLYDPMTGQIIGTAPAKEDASSNPDRILSATEAQSLGVPFGTSAGDAYGVTPTKPLTESQAKDITYANRGEEANTTIDSLGSKVAGYNSAAWLAATGAEGNSLLSPLAPDWVKNLRQAERNFGTAILRRESGAAISQSEFDTMEKQYFPRPGDDAQTLMQKDQLRKTAIESFKQSNPANKNSNTVGSGGDYSW